jgi:hypothetical protein
MSEQAEQAELTRKARTQDLRESEPVHEQYADWDESLLSTKNIPAREGYSQRWVRSTVKGEQDQANLQRKFNQGWRPRLLSTIPKGQFVAHVDFMGQEVIGIHGSILMEIPTELLNRHKKRVREATNLQSQSVKSNFLNSRDQNERGDARLSFEETSRTQRGRIAAVDD